MVLTAFDVPWEFKYLGRDTLQLFQFLKQEINNKLVDLEQQLVAFLLGKKERLAGTSEGTVAPIYHAYFKSPLYESNVTRMIRDYLVPYSLDTPPTNTEDMEDKESKAQQQEAEQRWGLPRSRLS